MFSQLGRSLLRPYEFFSARRSRNPYLGFMFNLPMAILLCQEEKISPAAKTPAIVAHVHQSFSLSRVVPDRREVHDPRSSRILLVKRFPPAPVFRKSFSEVFRRYNAVRNCSAEVWFQMARALPPRVETRDSVIRSFLH